MATRPTELTPDTYTPHTAEAPSSEGKPEDRDRFRGHGLDSVSKKQSETDVQRAAEEAREAVRAPAQCEHAVVHDHGRVEDDLTRLEG